MEIKKAYPASAATCIESYYYKLNMALPKGYTPSTKPPPGYVPRDDRKRRFGRDVKDYPQVDALPIVEREAAPEPETVEAPLEKRQACKEYAFFFARGTMEPASTNNMGMSAGPNMQKELDKAMPGKWHTQGVEFGAALSDNFCVGLPGGYNCMNQLNKYSKACPNTKIALAGFSQGGMVVRNCAAFVEPAVKSRIIAVVGVGDPFNGAPVKGIQASAVKSICYAQDGVCGGELSIGIYHAAYMVDNSVSTAVSFITSKTKAR
jgi:hypothetical protein